MAETAAVTTKRREGVQTQLNGIKYTIESWDGKDVSKLVKSVQKMTLDAIEVMKQPDPLLQKIGFVILAVQQSTQVSIRELNGKRLTRITVLDKDLYEWAMNEIHLLPEKLS